MGTDRATPNRSRHVLAVRLYVERFDARFAPSVTLPDPLHPAVPAAAAVAAPTPSAIALPTLTFNGPILIVPTELAAGRWADVDWGDGVVTPGAITPDAPGEFYVATQRTLAPDTTYQVTVGLTAAANPTDRIGVLLAVTTPADGAIATSAAPAAGYQVPRVTSGFGPGVTVPPAPASPESSPFGGDHTPPAPTPVPPPVSPPPAVPPPEAALPESFGNPGVRPTPAPAAGEPPVVHPGSQSQTDAGSLRAAHDQPPAGPTPLLDGPVRAATSTTVLTSEPRDRGPAPAGTPDVPGRESVARPVTDDRRSAESLEVRAPGPVVVTPRARPTTAARPAPNERAASATRVVIATPSDWHGVAVAEPATWLGVEGPPLPDPSLPLLAEYAGTPAPEAVFAAAVPAGGPAADRPNRPPLRVGQTLLAAAVGVGVRLFWARFGQPAPEGGGRRPMFDEPAAVRGEPRDRAADYRDRM
jgi:hypothetical protein